MIKKVYKEILFSGLQLAIILISSRLFSAYYVTEVVKDFWLMSLGSILLGFIFPIVMCLVIINNLRTNQGGYWRFAESFKSAFIIILVAFSLSYTIVDLFYCRYIDTNMKKNVIKAAYEARSTFLKQDAQGNSSKLPDFKVISDINTDNSLKNISISFAKNISLILLISLFLGAIYQKKPFIRNSDIL